MPFRHPLYVEQAPASHPVKRIGVPGNRGDRCPLGGARRWGGKPKDLQLLLFPNAPKPVTLPVPARQQKICENNQTLAKRPQFACFQKFVGDLERGKHCLTSNLRVDVPPGAQKFKFGSALQHYRSLSHMARTGSSSSRPSGTAVLARLAEYHRR